ncbi:MAG TPA: hypothetical protein VFK68_12015 [Propionibacteriaceae bacterium]|nr:hypothetical protein [Propionibacteriaceae bacterium]
MSATLPDDALAGGDTPDEPEAWHNVRRVLAWCAVFAALAAVVGFLSGVFWFGVVDLPTYTIGEDFRGYTTERGLTEVFATDAWFSGLGLVVGAGVGYVAWRWFRELGWPVTFLAALGALLAGLVCNVTGHWLGPHSFDARLAAASPNDVIPIDFQLHTPVVLLVWAFAGVLPVLVVSSLGPDAEEEPRPRRPRTRSVDRGRTQQLEVGQVVGHDIAPLPEPAPRRRFFFFGPRDGGS